MFRKKLKKEIKKDEFIELTAEIEKIVEESKQHVIIQIGDKKKKIPRNEIS